MKKLSAILLATIILTGIHTYIRQETCHAEDVIIIRKENKKGQGADIEIRPTRKNNKIEIRTRI